MLLLYTLGTSAQQKIRGTVVDEKGEALPGIVVKAMKGEDNRLMGYAVSDSKGEYEISLTAGREAGKVIFSGMGYQQVERRVEKSGADLGRVVMREGELELKEVTVKAPPVRTTGDTITYNVDQLKDKSDRTIEDVIKKIPGIDVDKDGRIKYQGEDINKFYIEGLDMLGGRYTLATQNIQPDDIAAISVYENHQPKRVLEGIEYSKHAALNLKMKRSSMLRPIVTATLGAGYGDEPLWLAEGTGLFIAPKKQYLLTAKTNNAGSFYEKEATNFLSGNLFPAPLAQGLLNSVSSDNARISRDRYTDNRSATGSLNTIRRLKENSTLSFNLGYHFNRMETRQSQVTEYWQDDAASIITREDMRNQSDRHGAWLTMKYERNEKRYYLSEALNAEGTLSRLTDKVDDGTPLRQRIKTDYYALDNRINAVWRRGNRLFTLNSDVALAQIPRSNLQAIYSQTDSLFVGQDVEGLKFRTTESTTYSWILGQYSILSLNARLQAEYDRLEAESSTDQGLYSGYTLRTAIYPSYKYQHNQLTWEVQLPLQMVDMRLTDRLADTRFSYNRPLASLRTSLNYRLHRTMRFSLGGEAMRVLGSMMDFVSAPIHTTYRMTRANATGRLDEKDQMGLNGSLNYRNPLHGTNFGLTANYQHGHSNLITGSNVSQSQTEQVWLKMKSTSDLWTVNLTAAKNLLGRGTVLTGSAHLASLRTRSLRQGSAYHLTNNTLTLKAGAHSTLLHRRLITDVDVLYTLSTQKIALMPGNNLRNDITPSLRITVAPTDKWEVYAKANMGYVQNNGGGFDNNFYLDAGVRYTHKRFEAELSGKNLTNQRDYTLRRFATLDRYTYVYHLRPAEVMAVFRLKF